MRAQIAELPSGTPPLSQFRVAGRAVFFLRQDADAEVATLVIRDASADAERVLLDPAGIGGAAHNTIDWYVPSPDARFVACGISQGGAERSTVHVIDVDSGSVMDATVAGIAFSFLSWVGDADGEFRSFW